MFKVTADGDLSFVSKSLHIFSDSSELDFMLIFRANKDCIFLFMMRDKTSFCCEKYCCLELNVNFLPDFLYSFDAGDFYLEIANTAHHE